MRQALGSPPAGWCAARSRTPERVQRGDPAAIDAAGRILGDREFLATGAGYLELVRWLTGLGEIVKVGVEGTGSYGAGLARFLAEQAVTVVEVDRPDRRSRRRQGKPDPFDAIAAARAALSGEACGIPKTRSGPVEAIRGLRVARRGAVKARRRRSTNCTAWS